jgi:predicted ATPase
MEAEFPGGVHYLDLTNLSQAESVERDLFYSLGINRVSGKTAWEQFQSELPTAPVLLIVDNCEHVRETAAKTINQALRSGRSLTVLATSRSALGLLGERVYALDSLSIPNPGDVPANNAQAIAWRARYAAAELFITRAEERGSYKFQASGAVQIGAICRRVDGIAYAIEIAAHRVHEFGIESLVERLNSALEVLVSNNPAAERRQQTMKSMVRWSVDLLKPNEIGLLRAMARFAGAFSLGMLHRVWNPDCDFGKVQLLAGNISGQALLQTAWGDDAREYRLFQIVREYALCEIPLPEPDNTEIDLSDSALNTRYIRAYAELVGKIAGQMTGQEQASAFKAIELEFSNVRAAVELGLAGFGSLSDVASLVDNLWVYCCHRGHAEAFLSWYNTLQDRVKAEGLDLESRLDLMNHAGNAALVAGKHTVAFSIFEEFLSLLRAEQEDPSDIAVGIGSIGLAYEGAQMYSEALTHTMDALEIIRKHNSGKLNHYVLEGNAASCLRNLGRFEEAVAFHRTSLKLQQESPVSTRYGRALCEYAFTLAQMGDYHQAAQELKHSLRWLDEVLSTTNSMVALCVGIILALHKQDLDGIASLVGCFDSIADLEHFQPDPHIVECRATAAVAVQSLTTDAYQEGYSAGYRSGLAGAAALVRRLSANW